MLVYKARICIPRTSSFLLNTHIQCRTPKLFSRRSPFLQTQKWKYRNRKILAKHTKKAAAIILNRQISWDMYLDERVFDLCMICIMKLNTLMEVAYFEK